MGEIKLYKHYFMWPGNKICNHFYQEEVLGLGHVRTAQRQNTCGDWYCVTMNTEIHLVSYLLSNVVCCVFYEVICFCLLLTSFLFCSSSQTL